MDIFLNFGLAWISVLIAVILALAYLTRKSIVAFPKVRRSFVTINKAFRKHHKLLGFLLIAVALIHGLFSSEAVLSVNLGTISWLLSILLGVSWMLRRKLTKVKSWMFYHRILVILFSLSIIIHVVDVGGIQIFNVINTTKTAEITQETTTEPAVTEESNQHRHGISDPVETSEAIKTPDEVDSDNISYIDGIYEGEATGFQPGLIVSVVIENNEMVSVEVISHNEVNSRYYQTPVNTIPGRIVEEQSTDVDIVSGATYTSYGIMKAVEDALSKAVAD